jgi:hypothetical protein
MLRHRRSAVPCCLIGSSGGAQQLAGVPHDRIAPPAVAGNSETDRFDQERRRRRLGSSRRRVFTWLGVRSPQVRWLRRPSWSLHPLRSLRAGRLSPGFTATRPLGSRSAPGSL